MIKDSNVNRASEKDLTEILMVQQKAFGEVAKMLGKKTLPPIEQTIDEIKEEYLNGIILKYVSEDGKIVGSVRGAESEKGICSVGKLIVLPEYQNKGIGKLLMTELEKQFPSCSYFILFTSPDTPNTVRLYSSLGYQVTNEDADNGMKMINMRKCR
jgi:ribosomal protein S18 acetylase RimI-like enzyme